MGSADAGEESPQAGKRWTDSGQVHDDRGLKHRAEDEPRGVPIPPALVKILREHIARFGVAHDGRLFRSDRGNVVAASTYSRVWEGARHFALTPHQVASPLAGRPYDLRHAAVSLWLNAGVPATEASDRAGHSVEVLLKVYAKCIDGQETTVNGRIDRALTGVAWPVSRPPFRIMPRAPRPTWANALKIIPRMFRDLRQTAASGDLRLPTPTYRVW